VKVVLKDSKMREEIKSTVSLFLQIPADAITDSTIIDRSSLGSSVLVHRMYGKLADAGFPVMNYHDIMSFGDLIKRLSGESTLDAIPTPFLPAPVADTKGGIGIDVEAVDSMPATDDFREDNFYLLNFSQREIAHCIMSVDPYASFAGLFAAKEAIYKAGGIPVNVPFSSIEIHHGADGKPRFNDLVLSISHTPTTAVAVAYKQGFQEVKTSTNIMEASPSNLYIFKLIALVALVFSIASLLMLIFK
jgi:phosphopantetheine--protein transferase-like protein